MNIKKLAEFMQDDTGQLSAMRLLFLGWGGGTLIIWTLLSIHSGTLLPLPISITTFISSLIAGKCVQNLAERDINVNTNTNVITKTE